MTRTREWLIPLTGVVFVILGIVTFLVGGEPKSADEPVREIVDYYVDNKNSVEAAAFIGVAATLFLVFFGAYLRKVLHAGAPDEWLSLVSFTGLVVISIGFAIDSTISFALAESAKDIDPTAAQALQALWDNDFIPLMLGVLMFLWATGLSVIRHGVLPKWLGWVMVALGVVGMTPIGFIAFLGSAILVVVLSVLLSLRARSAPATG
ncbi:MAG: hypothetical protein QOJ22_140 [Thermoleophilaceae bacterium]|jgi:hypothetical protein|nr:hypothetical protein [Thermoleophilaceae bacterium]